MTCEDMNQVIILKKLSYVSCVGNETSPQLLNFEL